MKRIFITGSSGSVGRKLTKRLLELGDEVIGFDVLRPKDNDLPQSRFRFIEGDILDFEVLKKASYGSDAAIHCAALLPCHQHLGKEKFISINSFGTENFLKACMANDLDKAIIISNTGVLKPSKNGVTYDDSEYRNSHSPYILSKVLAEKKIDELHAVDKINYVILRSSAIYGPGMYYKWGSIFEMAKRDRLFVVSSGDGLYSIIHIDDFIDAVILTLEKLNRDISGEKITVTSPEKIPIYEIMRIISDYYESSPPKKFPFAVALVIAAVCQVFSRILGKGFLSSISVENIIDYRNGLFFDYQKARTILGFQSKMVFKEEIVRAIKDYENQKKY